jgi:hypothetical protein
VISTLSQLLPTSPFNPYRYVVKFDTKGRFEALTIDFEAMTVHIQSLHILSVVI